MAVNLLVWVQINRRDGWVAGVRSSVLYDGEGSAVFDLAKSVKLQVMVFPGS